MCTLSMPDWPREMVPQAVLRTDIRAVGAKLLCIDERVSISTERVSPSMNACNTRVSCSSRGDMTHVLRLSRQDDPGYVDQLALARTLSAVIRNSLFMATLPYGLRVTSFCCGSTPSAAAPGLSRSMRVAYVRGTWEACSRTAAHVSQSKMMFR
jgi:hypothetical protein